MFDLAYRVALSRVAGIGAAKFRRLEEHFGGLDLAWKASPRELEAAGLDERARSAFMLARQTIDPEREIEALFREGVRAYGWDDPSYPERLREIASPPPVLYVRGNLTAADDWSIGVVGTRRVSPYGRQAAALFSGELVRAGITIVSGLAKGVDTVAHLAALDAGGRTIAVLGSGLDVVYPAENSRLAERIADHGAVVSDYPLGTQPAATNFPFRNRIISGLSRGILVVEADDRSGALITAGYALDQGREVFAVPGSIFAPLSRGTNRLVRDGQAKLVSQVSDILDELQIGDVVAQAELRVALPDDPTEAALVQQLTAEPTHVDDLCRACGLPIAAVSAALAMLELKGHVRHVGAMQYVLAR